LIGRKSYGSYLNSDSSVQLHLAAETRETGSTGDNQGKNNHEAGENSQECPHCHL
jgi:hypothetical protein